MLRTALLVVDFSCQERPLACILIPSCKDCAIGKGSEVPVEIMEGQSHNEVNPSDIAAENESPMSQESRKRMQMVTEAIVKDNEDCTYIAKMLKDMGLSPMYQIDALILILKKP
ncbi:hypothetical protein L3X38_036618 [Prunus dulcis]|uniref:Uncharacterized protein n=1 Tax=Prunus dulcis TaxID=3755 RepID=A0AAD4YPL3_PRUDU|nr:hypothetical protein L3X38_036618 [Prunus dulcis]